MLNSKNIEKLGHRGALEKYYTGVVEDSTDPLKIGRLKVRIPELYGTIPTDHLPWCNPASPFGGAGSGSPGYQEGSGYGFFFIPVPGSKVKVHLWRGHPWFPEWYGTHWFRGEVPDEANIAPPTNYVLKTPKGHLMDFHDDVPYMRFKDRGGNFIIIDTSEDTIKLRARENIRMSALNIFDLTASRDIRMKTSANFHLTVGGNIFIDAGGTVNIKGTPINLNGPGTPAPLEPEEANDVDHLAHLGDGSEE